MLPSTSDGGKLIDKYTSSFFQKWENLKYTIYSSPRLPQLNYLQVPRGVTCSPFNALLALFPCLCYCLTRLSSLSCLSHTCKQVLDLGFTSGETPVIIIGNGICSLTFVLQWKFVGIHLKHIATRYPRNSVATSNSQYLPTLPFPYLEA